MMRPRTLTTWLLAGLLPVQAQAFWTIESEIRSSSADANSTYLSIDRSVGENGLFYVSLAQTRVDTSGTDLDTSSQTLGGLYRLNDRWRLSGFYERWGKSGDIVSDRISGRVSGEIGSFDLSFSGGGRWITLEAGAPARTDPGPGDGPGGGPPITIPVDPGGGGNGNDPTVAEDYDLAAGEAGMSVGWRFTKSTSVSMGGAWTDYDQDPAQLMARDQIESLSESAISLAQGFLDRSIYLEGRHDFGDYRELSLYLARDRSAVDGRTARTYSVSWIQPIGDAWDLRIEVGRTRTEGFDTSQFGGLSLTWYP